MSHRINRRRARGRRPIPRPHIASPGPRIVASVRQIRLTCLTQSRGLKQLFQKRPAPSAACARTIALPKLTFTLRPLHPPKVHDLALGHVKAKTQLIVEFHAERLTPTLFMLEPRKTGCANVACVAPKRCKLDPHHIHERFQNPRPPLVAYPLQECPANSRFIAAERHRPADQHSIGVNSMYEGNNTNREPVGSLHDQLASNLITPFRLLIDYKRSDFLARCQPLGERRRCPTRNRRHGPVDQRRSIPIAFQRAAFPQRIHGSVRRRIDEYVATLTTAAMLAFNKRIADDDPATHASA